MRMIFFTMMCLMLAGCLSAPPTPSLFLTVNDKKATVIAIHSYRAENIVVLEGVINHERLSYRMWFDEMNNMPIVVGDIVELQPQSSRPDRSFSIKEIVRK